MAISQQYYFQIFKFSNLQIFKFGIMFMFVNYRITATFFIKNVFLFAYIKKKY